MKILFTQPSMHTSRCIQIYIYSYSLKHTYSSLISLVYVLTQSHTDSYYIHMHKHILQNACTCLHKDIYNCTSILILSHKYVHTNFDDYENKSIHVHTQKKSTHVREHTITAKIYIYEQNS